jgi:hypothetical protein
MRLPDAIVASLLDALGDAAFGLSQRPDDSILAAREVRAQHIVAIAADRLVTEIDGRCHIGQWWDRASRVLSETSVTAIVNRHQRTSQQTL